MSRRISKEIGEIVRARLAREHTILALLAVFYVIGGRISLRFALDHSTTTFVWPPAGIALGAFLILGYRIWPLILGAALVLYVWALGSLPVVIPLAAGAVLEAMLAAYLVNRYAGGRHALQTPRNALRFAGVALLASAIVSSTCAAGGTVASGLASWTDYGQIWLTQAVGSLTGTLLVAPIVLLYSQRSSGRWRTAQVVEGVGAIGCLLLVALAAFYRGPVELRGLPSELLCTPALLWVALRLGRRASATSLLGVAAFAIFGTLRGYGPFVRATPDLSLLIVQLFLGITAVMTLTLAALASEYVVAGEQLRELVLTDPLTGLPNYRRLLEVLGMEMTRADRHDRPFAVVFFDMDGLKRINDELGHLIGSRAVCRFAETLGAACRATDTAARYGGDEFVAVLSDTDEEGAHIVISRVTDRLAKDPDDPPLAVSAGVAMYPRDGRSPTTLLSAADRALYAVKAGKAAGKRRAVVGLRELSSAGTR